MTWKRKFRSPFFTIIKSVLGKSKQPSFTHSHRLLPWFYFKLVCRKSSSPCFFFILKIWMGLAIKIRVSILGKCHIIIFWFLMPYLFRIWIECWQEKNLCQALHTIPQTNCLVCLWVSVIIFTFNNRFSIYLLYISFYDNFFYLRLNIELKSSIWYS